MAKALTTTKSSSLAGDGVADLEQKVRQLAVRKAWAARKPFPTTRALGEAFNISNASVSRVLQKLADEGVIWRNDNGRFFSAESRLLMERRKPYACLLRKFQTWSRAYHEIMMGFTQAFGRNATALLIVHNDTLVTHEDTEHPPMHADASAQAEALAEFFHSYDYQVAGVLLDDVWRDEVLAKHQRQLTNAVMLCRPTSLSGLSSVSVDFDAATLTALGHLYARGYEEVWLGVPFSHSRPIDLMVEAMGRSATRLGMPIAPENIHSVATPQERAKFVARLKAAEKRIGVFCPEDNIALLLWRGLAAAGVECPGRVGLLAGMGTSIVTEHRLSTIQINYELIGLTAAEILERGRPQAVTLPAPLAIGKTT